MLKRAVEECDGVLTVLDFASPGAETTLADFKGEWVLLEFWGFW